MSPRRVDSERKAMRMTGLRLFSIPALLVGLVFFTASLTPSMIPRGPLIQGVLGGLVTALGYLAARIVALIWYAADMPVLTGKAARWAVILCSVAVLALFDTAPPPPAQAGVPGGPGSLIDWGAMGQPGREFVTSGPDAQAIAAFTGRPALDPIRVYVGRADGDTAHERARLALAELQRLGAFDREVLVVASPTGTGWLDPGSHDPLEYMHDGNIATVAAQYSYLQSPLALILETTTGLDTATALLEVVHDYWKTLPPDDRPRFYVHGLSLGAWSSMYATNLFRLVNDPIDGALWAGPPFPSNFWNYVQNARDPDSPWVLPRIGDGSLVRYASHVADASDAAADWGDMRIVFLQYSSDPIVFYDPYSLWRAPPWMNEPPAEDASSHMSFMPIVTQFQLALDMALSFGAPPGHGHAYYAQDYIAPWVQVTAPADWTDADTERLKAHCDNGFQMGCTND